METNAKEKLLTVGELARRVGVTVRTLQYYDSSGLLSPKAYSEGGRRMYDRRDVIRLHQILFLKSFGFSLEEIRDRLLPTESSHELAHMFHQQQKLLKARMAHLQEAVDQLGEVIGEVQLDGEIGIERLFALMHATRVGNPYSFMIRHLSQEHIDHYYKMFDNEAAADQLNNFSKTLTTKLIELYQRQVNPEGPEGQQLARDWWELVMSLTKGDPVLIQNMFATGADDANWPSDMQDLKQATQDFLGQALNAYFKSNNIVLPFKGGD